MDIVLKFIGLWLLIAGIQLLIHKFDKTGNKNIDV